MKLIPDFLGSPLCLCPKEFPQVNLQFLIQSIRWPVQTFLRVRREFFGHRRQKLRTHT